MKRTFVAIGAVALLVASLVQPASAGGGKKLTFFLHGTQQAGETQLNETWLDGLLMTMDAKKPAAGAPKSIFVTNYVAGPNTQCSGNGLLPVWKGDVVGSATGTVTITLHTVATPATAMNVELFPDGQGGCESSLGSTGYQPPAAAAKVAMTPGHAETKVVFKNVKFKMGAWLILQLSIADDPHPGQVRVLYDSADFASSVQMTVN